MYSEDDLLPLSGLQHLLYCERQWALIHIEQQWAENRLTAQGRVLHRVVDERPDESHSGFRVVRSLPLRSLRLGVAGKADVVLFPLAGPEPGSPARSGFSRGGVEEPGSPARSGFSRGGVEEPGSPARGGFSRGGVEEPGSPARSGFSRGGVEEPGSPARGGFSRGGVEGPPIPVEYKRGKPKPGDWDTVQLCAQALCLEEMQGIAVPEGALFYGMPRRRTSVIFTAELRGRTEQAARRMHELYRAGISPLAVYESRKCDRCSLLELCRPKSLDRASRASRFLQSAIQACLKSD